MFNMPTLLAHNENQHCQWFADPVELQLCNHELSWPSTAGHGFKTWVWEVLTISSCPESPSSRANVFKEERCECNINPESKVFLVDTLCTSVH